MKIKITITHDDNFRMGEDKISITMTDVRAKNLGSVLRQLPQSIAQVYGAEKRLICTESLGNPDFGDVVPENFILQQCTE